MHRTHHESFNPDPFSGLSMHPVESAIYFSSAPMVVGWGPLWLCRLMFKALVVCVPAYSLCCRQRCVACHFSPPSSCSHVGCVSLFLCLSPRFPLEGHYGFGSWNIESSFNHYIHHSKVLSPRISNACHAHVTNTLTQRMHTCIQFNWNYGSSPAWDHLMGTNYLDGGGVVRRHGWR